MYTFTSRTFSSLAKVFPDEYPPYREVRNLTGLANEELAFQVAFMADYDSCRRVQITASVDSDLAYELFRVECTPSDMPIYPDHDPYLLRTKPGLYPDLLRPVAEGDILEAPGGQWQALWIKLPGQKAPGKHKITVTLSDLHGVVLSREQMTADILAADLPEQTLLHTSWFHTDCLSTWYGVEPMSEEYWRIVENYARTAREHGLTLLLTPLFTPPLDTAVGSERPTVQLVDVHVIDGKYSFNFDKLGRWFDMAHRVGIQWFEMSHLFTQWGAYHAPKIMAWVDGKYRRIFGWETDSLGEEYEGFLKAFAAALIPYLQQTGVADHCIFHVSDEPSIDIYDQYSRCAKLISSLFPGFKVIDALSHVDYYEKGVIKCPVPKTPVVEEFLQAGVEKPWAYYCCGQYKLVSNRFFCMSMARTRVLGMQMYKYDLEGFLQWGFNFWYSQLSKAPIDPFRVSDAGYAFPSGDAYVVYPGPDGQPLCSLRLKAFSEGINDLRALRLLESLIGRKKTLAVLEKGLPKPLTFEEYPRGDEWLLAKRAEINACIRRALAKKS